MSQEGRIGGPLLAQDLLRNGTDLAFETSLLYLNVGSGYLGVNTQGPSSELTIGTVKNNGGTTNSKIGTVNLRVDTTANIGNFTIGTNTIQHLTSSITITPASSGTSITPGLSTNSLYSYGNIVTTTVTNDNINITPNSSLVTTSSVQNQAGTDNATGLFTGGFTGANVLGRVLVGWSIVGQPLWTVTAIDPIAQTITITGGIFLSGTSYQFTGFSSGQINFANGNGSVDVTVNAGLHATGSITWDGNITLGNQLTDTITFAAEVSSDILPKTTNTYNWGSNALKWNNLTATTLTATSSGVTSAINATTVNVGNFILSNNTISNANNDINFTTTGTGQVKFDNWTYINGSVLTGSATATANILTQNSPLFIGIDDENLLFNNTLTVTAFDLISTGNGYIKFGGTSAVVFPIGNTNTRPASPPKGTIRYNSQLGSGELWNGFAWIPVGGASATLTSAEVVDVNYAWDLILG